MSIKEVKPQSQHQAENTAEPQPSVGKAKDRLAAAKSSIESKQSKIQSTHDHADLEHPATSKVQGLLGALTSGIGSLGGALTPTPKPAPTPKDTSKVDPQNPGKEGIDKVVQSVNAGGDLKQLDQLDNFRSRLTPDQQKKYDQQLEQLRDDPRINFDYRNGAQPDEALEDLALRGIAAANFNNPKLQEQVLANSAKDGGKFNITVYPDAIPWKDFYKDKEGTLQGALATPQNGIAVEQKDFYGFLKSGDNAFVHEFSHLQQRVRQDGSQKSERVPGDFPYAKQFEKAFSDPKFQKYLTDHFLGGNAPKEGEALGKAESWPTVQNLFHQNPAALKEASPEIYQQLTRYSGIDPLTGKETPPVQLNGSGDPNSLKNLSSSFDSIADKTGRVGKSELENVLKERNASPELQSTAALLLSSPVWRNYLDVGQGKGEVDGHISKKDLEKGLQGLANLPTGAAVPVTNRDQAQSVLDQYKSLADTAAGKGERDGHVSRGDLEALVKDPGTPEQLRLAASYLLQ